MSEAKASENHQTGPIQHKPFNYAAVMEKTELPSLNGSDNKF